MRRYGRIVLSVVTLPLAFVLLGLISVSVYWFCIEPQRLPRNEQQVVEEATDVAVIDDGFLWEYFASDRFSDDCPPAIYVRRNGRVTETPISTLHHAVVVRPNFLFALQCIRGSDDGTNKDQWWISRYEIEDDGNLSPPYIFYRSTDFPDDLAVTPDGRFATVHHIGEKDEIYPGMTTIIEIATGMIRTFRGVECALRTYDSAYEYAYVTRSSSHDYYGFSEVRVANKRGDERILCVVPPDAGVDRIEWAPDGQHIAILFGRGNGTDDLNVFNRSGGLPAQILATEKDYLVDFQWSPDSTSIAFHFDEGYIGLIDVRSGSVSPISNKRIRGVYTFVEWVDNTSILCRMQGMSASVITLKE